MRPSTISALIAPTLAFIPGRDLRFAISIDETTVYNELIDTFYVDKVKLKKFDTAAKLDALADVGLQYASLSDYAAVSFEDGLTRKNAA